MPIGDRIRELRLRKGQSLQDVADAVGASKAHIWDLESNRSRNPSLELITALAKHFETSVAFLVEEPEGAPERVQQFYRQNERRFATMTDDDLELVERLLKKISDGD
jgi:transcriptional regulator with XRE-family HTH domain